MHFYVKRRKAKKRHSRRFPSHACCAYEQEFRSLAATIPTWSSHFYADTRQGEEARLHAWPRIEVIGSALTDKYAWAVPDARALRIVSFFSPLIEVGAGKGYWASLLEKRGADIVCFDKVVPKKSERWTNVRSGGPEVLSTSVASGRNLFLCYPDEDAQLGSACIEAFDGDFVIHVGELVCTPSAPTLSEPQMPYGRTTTAQTQEALMASFHCVLSLQLQGYPHARDHLTVWKRTAFVPGKEDYENDDDDDGSKEEDEEEMPWASIPPSEILPSTLAAPKYEFLLN